MRIKLGFLFGFCYLALFFILPPAEPLFLIPGLIFILLGESIRIASSGYIRKSEELSVSGPYAHVRHPLYTGSFLMSLGFLLIIFSPGHISSVTLLAGYLVLFPMTYLKTIKKEDAFLENEFKEKFLEYKKNVPLIFPRISPYQKGGEFRWKQVLRNREYNAALAAFGILVLFFLKNTYS